MNDAGTGGLAVTRPVEAHREEVLARGAALIDIPAVTVAERPNVAIVIIRDEADSETAEGTTSSRSRPRRAFTECSDLASAVQYG